MPFYFFFTLLLLKISVAILQVLVWHDVAEIPKPTADICYRGFTTRKLGKELSYIVCWNFVHVLRENAAEGCWIIHWWKSKPFLRYNLSFGVLFSLKNISSGQSEMDRVAWFSREGMTLAICKQPRPLNCALSVSLSYCRIVIKHLPSSPEDCGYVDT